MTQLEILLYGENSVNGCPLHTGRINYMMDASSKSQEYSGYNSKKEQTRPRIPSNKAIQHMHDK